MPRAPPTPALKSRGRAPLPPPRGVAGGGVGGWPRTGPASVTGMVHTGLSLIAAYDDLMRCGSVFHSGAEREFWSVTGKIKELRQRWLAAENDRRQMAISLKERENELTAKDYKIQQARKMVEDERRGRLAAEQDRDAFAQQVKSATPHPGTCPSFFDASFDPLLVGHVEGHPVVAELGPRDRQ